MDEPVEHPLGTRLTPEKASQFLLGLLPREESLAIERDWSATTLGDDGWRQLTLDDPFSLAFRGIRADSTDSKDLVEFMRRVSKLCPETPTLSNWPAAGAGSSSPPTRLGVYEIQRELGRGGMGTVFEAVDTRLHRVVALKLLNSDRARSAQSRERFLLEARSAAKIESDHIVPIYDVGEIDGYLFFTMPSLKGESLKSFIDQGAVCTWREIVEIGRQMAVGLAVAHARGLVHRDVKPENIWLEQVPGSDSRRVRLLDFGVARRLDDSSLGPTLEGSLVGTPAYMSPEQARGDKVDHRADLFSLGVVLYRLATGALPFQGEHVLALLSSLAIDEPEAPADLNPSIPKALSDLILSLLSKNPLRRPQTAAQVADQLEALSRQSLTTLAERQQSQRRYRWLVGTLVLIGLIVGVGMFGVQSLKPVQRATIETGQLGIEAKVIDTEWLVPGATSQDVQISPGKHRLRVSFKDQVFETSPLVVPKGKPTTLRVDRRWDQLRVQQDGEVVQQWALSIDQTLNPWRHGVGRGVYVTPDTLLEVKGLTLPNSGELTLETYVTPAFNYVNGPEPRFAEMVGTSAMAISKEGNWFLYTFDQNLLSPVRAEPRRRVHLAAVRMMGRRRLYLDGKLIARDSYRNVGFLDSERKGLLLALRFEGTLEQMRISTVARYNLDFIPTEKIEADENTLALYPCDEGQGVVLHDRSGNENHVTIQFNETESTLEVADPTTP
jgi:serine/threonine protein kinase